MDAIGFKKRLEEAKRVGEKVKLIFQYPATSKAVVKSGFVIECYDDCFWFDEKFDGKVTYSYTFIVEIKSLSLNEVGNDNSS